jgi:hypothetical protein
VKVENYNYVVYVKFNKAVSIPDQLNNILNIKLKLNRLLQTSDIGTYVNNGINYTYEIVSNDTIKLTLIIDTPLQNPNF